MSENVSIRSTLIEIGAIDDRRVERFAEQTRDRDIPVWHDPNTGVIFIDGFYVGDGEYESGKYPGAHPSRARRILPIRSADLRISGHSMPIAQFWISDAGPEVFCAP